MKQALGIALTVLWPAFAAADTPLPKADATFPPQDPALVQLGRLLFFDPILSGNKEVSCATCHHPRFHTSDGVSLGMGDGGAGLGPERRADPANQPEQLIPRNAPGLFNLGATEFTTFFHDGRLEADPSRPTGLRTPLGAEMESGFASALSAQAMFPVLSPDEMAGHYAENPVAKAVRQGRLTGPGGAWDILVGRIAEVPEYRDGFAPLVGAGKLHFTDIADALAAFIAVEWRADDSLFDAFLRGERDLPDAARRGMDLFYGSAGCAACHSGQFQTDHAFHAIAMPQFGPGKAERFENHNRDTGRMRVTGRPEDAYRFRTPSLRNVWQTAPYGHNGAYATLDAVIRHHLDPVAGLVAYDPAQLVLPKGMDSSATRKVAEEERARIAAANGLRPQKLSDADIADLMAFLATLTDPASLTGTFGIPDHLPSGLPLDR